MRIIIVYKCRQGWKCQMLTNTTKKKEGKNYQK